MQHEPSKDNRPWLPLSMTPAAIPRARNELVMTMDEARHKRVQKGFAYEAVPASYHPDPDAKRQRQHSSKYADEVPPMPRTKQAQWDSRGVKRKAEHTNGGEHWQGSESMGGSGGYSMDEEARKAERKRARKAQLLAELEKLEKAKSELNQREQSLLMTKPIGDDESRDAWPQNGGAGPRPMHPPPPPQLSRQTSDGKEKRTPKVNPLYSGSEFVSAQTGQDHLPANAVSKGGANGKGGKKAAAAGGDAKRSIERERAKRKDAIWKKVASVVQKKLLGDSANSWYFVKPVDPVALNIPTYFDIIKRPMDLGTIGKKLRSKQYADFDQYEADVRLTFRNAMKFNGPENLVHKAAAHLLTKFDREWWPPIQQAIDSDRQQTAEEERSLRDAEWQAPKKAPKAPASSAKKAPKAKAPLPAPASSKQSSGGYAKGAYKPPPPKPKVKPMSMEEKRDLSIALSDMGADMLTGIVDIIKERHADLMSNDEELELDIDALDDVTLWELKRYVEEKMGEEAQSRPPPPVRDCAGCISLSCPETRAIWFLFKGCF